MPGETLARWLSAHLVWASGGLCAGGLGEGNSVFRLPTPTSLGTQGSQPSGALCWAIASARAVWGGERL